MQHPLTILALSLYSRERARLSVMTAATGEELVTAGVRFVTADRCAQEAFGHIIARGLGRLVGTGFGGGK